MFTIAIAHTVLAKNLLMDLGRFTVVSYMRKEAFAGELGNRIEETLVVQRDGKRYTISFPRRHTRFSRRLENYCPGEDVTINGAIKGDRIVAERGKVRNVLPPHRHEPDESKAPEPTKGASEATP